jgi:hypothetical protein
MGKPPQATSIPTIKPYAKVQRSRFMSLLLLEALGAMVLLLLIVWWTMFSGRKHGELPPSPPAIDKTGKEASAGVEKT